MKKSEIVGYSLTLLLVLGLCWLYWDRGEEADFDYKSLQHTELGVVVTLNMPTEEVIALFDGSLIESNPNETEITYLYRESCQEAYPTYFHFVKNKLHDIRTYSPYFETLDGTGISNPAGKVDWLFWHTYNHKQRFFRSNSHLTKHRKHAAVIHSIQYNDTGLYRHGRYLLIQLAT